MVKIWFRKAGDDPNCITSCDVDANLTVDEVRQVVRKRFQLQVTEPFVDISRYIMVFWQQF